ncbi:MAG: exosortase H [bacterium]|nr:exosortase H [bacterium]
MPGHRRTRTPQRKPSPPGATPSEPARTSEAAGGGWRAYRQEIRFLLLFVLILGGGFSLLALNPVNDRVVEPFTAGVARVSGGALDLIGQEIEMRGTVIESDRFAVNIRNGCNGVETMIIFLAAVLAFPSTWKSRGVGLVLGILAIQVVNLVRVVALFLTGVYFPEFFASSHTVVWQTLVILFGVLLWIFWANRFAVPVTAAVESE